MTSPVTNVPLLEARSVYKHFPVRRGLLQRVVAKVRAVDGVDLEILPLETFGLVGESGCGKSTLGRTLVRLLEPTSGEIRFQGEAITRLQGRETKRIRRDMQFIFQDSATSLNPRKTIGEIVAEGLLIHNIGTARERHSRALEIMNRVGLGPALADRYPQECSGGQRQRVGIARALVLEPKLVIADEPVSSLDVSIQSQVLNLLVDLRQRFGLTYLFIAHNLAVVTYIADRVAVMYLGKVVELATSEDLLLNPLHPYTVSLLSAIPDVMAARRRKRVILAGEIPSPMSPPSGCHFRTRCPIAQPICAEVEPTLVSGGRGHSVACHFPGTFSG